MKKGNIVVLALIIVALIGLYFAFLKRDIAVPPSTTGATLAELWETGREGRTQPPRTGAAGSSSPAAEAPGTTAPAGGYPYAKQYMLYPKKADIPGNKYLICVNRDYFLPAKYAVKTAVCVTAYPEKRQMETQAAAQFRAMYDAASAFDEALELIPFSAYRSTAQQKKTFDGEIDALIEGGLGRQEAIERAMLTIQPPGCSEHETGLAVDLTRKGVWRTDPGFAESNEYKWLQAHAHEYGFILRYPKGKEQFTGIAFEPWHWRYVGAQDAAAMRKSGQCLEEYLGLVN